MEFSSSSRFILSIFAFPQNDIVKYRYIRIAQSLTQSLDKYMVPRWNHTFPILIGNITWNFFITEMLKKKKSKC